MGVMTRTVNSVGTLCVDVYKIKVYPLHPDVTNWQVRSIRGFQGSIRRTRSRFEFQVSGLAAWHNGGTSMKACLQALYDATPERVPPALQANLKSGEPVVHVTPEGERVELG